jgi:tRNA U34 5-methylaminomethyl-2-thiouridine-forming methyltransferase MnmC
MSTRRFEISACTQGSTLRDPENGQTMHSSIGPEVEAELIFLSPSKLRERLAEKIETPLVLWDVGMGIAANSVLAWRLATENPESRPLEIHSFEKFPEALAQALEDLGSFSFLRDSERHLRELLEQGETLYARDRSERSPSSNEASTAPHRWILHSGDFCSILKAELELTHRDSGSRFLAPPELIFWDFYTPRLCPELWSLELFSTLRTLAPNSRLFTYSAATPVRLGLLLAGFYVGRPESRSGRATPIKSECTMAVANDQAIHEISEILGATWMEKLSRSSQFRPYGQTFWATTASYEDIRAELLRCRQMSHLSPI